MGYNKFNARFTVLFVANNTLVALTLLSLFGKSSMTFPIFHGPLGTFAFIWIISPLDGISFASTRGDFRFICDLSRRDHHPSITSKTLPINSVLSSRCWEVSLSAVDHLDPRLGFPKQCDFVNLNWGALSKIICCSFPRLATKRRKTRRNSLADRSAMISRWIALTATQKSKQTHTFLLSAWFPCFM